ncbi:hypothetical protein DBV15_08281 [Temnothorax longispinosus]|uniref:Uncharacterized protein n=1 Tax=Temnothorax longispinosus TaxID=300112 RepID=A0A4S2KGI8_9HYME|nr:hypothetical protein DBV15_08281 [Temnothorax longispinosus]
MPCTLFRRNSRAGQSAGDARLKGFKEPLLPFKGVSCLCVCLPSGALRDDVLSSSVLKMCYVLWSRRSRDAVISISSPFHNLFVSSLLLSPTRSSFLFPPRVLSSSYCWLDVFAHPPFAPVLIIASQQPLKCHPGKIDFENISRDAIGFLSLRLGGFSTIGKEMRDETEARESVISYRRFQRKTEHPETPLQDALRGTARPKGCRRRVRFSVYVKEPFKRVASGRDFSGSLLNSSTTLPLPRRRLIDTGERKEGGQIGAARAVLVNSNLGTSRFFIPLARLTKTTGSASRDARDRGVFVRGQSQRRSTVWYLSPDTLIFPELASDRS